MRQFARIAFTMAAGVSSLAICHSARAQQAEPPVAQVGASDGVGDIVVTAQRRSESLQNVPIAIAAFDTTALERQQIRTTSDLYLSIPSVTFTKSQFASSNFTIRGIGDAAIATSGDTSVGIAINEMPLVTTRLFETDYFDLERVEVLRGPQGTLFGRNATGGVISFVTAKPDLSGIHASATLQYGNYDTRRAEGMFNLPLTPTLGIRLAGTYLKRDGYTENLYNGNSIDGRDQYALRGSIRWQPDAHTTVDLMGYYFKEDSNRSRIQKQLCHRDPTGVLGCLPDYLTNQTVNNNSTLGTTLSSQEFFRIVSGSAAIGAVGLGSIYGTDSFSSAVNPADVRKVDTDFDPTYRADELQLMGKIIHDFGPVTLNLTGGYARNKVNSRVDYNLAVENPISTGPDRAYTRSAISRRRCSPMPSHTCFRATTSASRRSIAVTPAISTAISWAAHRRVRNMTNPAPPIVNIRSRRTWIRSSAGRSIFCSARSTSITRPTPTISSRRRDWTMAPR